jgi:hypothetical protein
MTIECRHSRDAVICDPEALEGKLLPPMNEYEEADQAELEDHAEFLRGRQLTDPSRPLDIAAWVLLGLLIFVATCEGCVIFWRMIFGAPK